MELISIATIAGSVTLGVFGKFAYDGIRRRNGNGGNLKAHNDSSTAHKDIRDDITKIDEKLDGIVKTSNRILAHLTTRHGTS